MILLPPRYSKDARIVEIHTENIVGWDVRRIGTDMLHNYDGPAYIRIANEKYYLNGVELSKDVWEKAVKENLTPSREGSATVFLDSDGRLHSDYMPSRIQHDGSEEWFHHGKRQCLTGPADTSGGRKRYFLDDYELTEEEYTAWRHMGSLIAFDREQVEAFNARGNRTSTYHKIKFSTYDRICKAYPAYRSGRLLHGLLTKQIYNHDNVERIINVCSEEEIRSYIAKLELIFGPTGQNTIGLIEECRLFCIAADKKWEAKIKSDSQSAINVSESATTAASIPSPAQEGPTLTITNLLVGKDRILVGPDNDGDLNRMQLSLVQRLHNIETSVITSYSIPTDTPHSGTIRVELESGEFKRVEYTSYVGSTFAIKPTDFSMDKSAPGSRIYISYIDRVATSPVESVTMAHYTERELNVRIRNAEKPPFETTVRLCKSEVTLNVPRREGDMVMSEYCNAPIVSEDAQLSPNSKTATSWEVRRKANNWLHNFAGPAVVTNKSEAYYINGINLTKELWEKASRYRLWPAKTDSAKGPLLYFYEDADKTIRHAEGMPAIIWEDGNAAWYHHGMKHRIDGPALTDPVQYYLSDTQLTAEEFQAWLEMRESIIFPGLSKVFDEQGLMAPPPPTTINLNDYKLIKAINPQATVLGQIRRLISEAKLDADTVKKIAVIRNSDSIAIYLQTIDQISMSYCEESKALLEAAGKIWLDTAIGDWNMRDTVVLKTQNNLETVIVEPSQQVQETKTDTNSDGIMTFGLLTLLATTAALLTTKKSKKKVKVVSTAEVFRK